MFKYSIFPIPNRNPKHIRLEMDIHNGQPQWPTKAFHHLHLEIPTDALTSNVLPTNFNALELMKFNMQNHHNLNLQTFFLKNSQQQSLIEIKNKNMKI